MTNQPSSPPGGRSLFRVVAVLLALGVLGYLMWRSQRQLEVPPSDPRNPTGAVSTPTDPPATEPARPPKRLPSSKSLVIDPENDPVERRLVFPPESEATTPPATPPATPPQTTPR